MVVSEGISTQPAYTRPVTLSGSYTRQSLNIALACMAIIKLRNQELSYGIIDSHLSRNSHIGVVSVAKAKECGSELAIQRGSGWSFDWSSSELSQNMDELTVPFSYVSVINNKLVASGSCGGNVSYERTSDNPIFHTTSTLTVRAALSSPLEPDTFEDVRATGLLTGAETSSVRIKLVLKDTTSDFDHYVKHIGNHVVRLLGLRNAALKEGKYSSRYIYPAGVMTIPTKCLDLPLKKFKEGNPSAVELACHRGWNTARTKARHARSRLVNIQCMRHGMPTEFATLLLQGLIVKLRDKSAPKNMAYDAGMIRLISAKIPGRDRHGKGNYSGTCFITSGEGAKLLLAWARKNKGFERYLTAYAPWLTEELADAERYINSVSEVKTRPPVWWHDTNSDKITKHDANMSIITDRITYLAPF